MLIFALAIQAGAKWQFIHFVVIRLDFIGFCAFRWELSVMWNTTLRFLGEQFKVTWKSLNFANLKLNSSLSYQQLKGQSTTTSAATTARQTSDKCNNCAASSSCCPKTSENFTKLQQKQIANEGESTRSFDHSLSRSFIHSFIRSSTHSVTHLGSPFMLSFIQLSLCLLIAYKSCRLSVARPSPPSWHLFVN